jgi:hypothetical protein
MRWQLCELYTAPEWMVFPSHAQALAYVEQGPLF